MDTRPVLLNQAAKIVRRRRTADEAGFSVPSFDAGDARPRFPKIQRREAAGRKGKLTRVAETESTPPPTHRPVKHRSSIRLDNAVVSDTAVACDWPMSGKEKAHPKNVIRHADDSTGTNVAFPLVYDITQSMRNDQITDKDEMGNYIENMDSCDSQTAVPEFDVSALLSRMRCSNGRRGSIDTQALRSTVAAFSNMTVSANAHFGTCAKSKKRPVYLLIIFASFDAEHRLKCDAYITCVNRIPTGRSERSLGISWIMSQLVDMFERQQAASGRFNGSQRWMVACCLVEALAQNPRFVNVNAYWRNGREGLEIAPIEMLRQIASNLNLKKGVKDEISGANLAALAMTVANQLASHSVSSSFDPKTMLEFGNGLRSTVSNNSLCENLALMAMMSRAACWLMEEVNRFSVHQLTAPASHNRL